MSGKLLYLVKIIDIKKKERKAIQSRCFQYVCLKPFITKFSLHIIDLKL